MYSIQLKTRSPHHSARFVIAHEILEVPVDSAHNPRFSRMAHVYSHMFTHAPAVFKDLWGSCFFEAWALTLLILLQARWEGVCVGTAVAVLQGEISESTSSAPAHFSLVKITFGACRRKPFAELLIYLVCKECSTTLARLRV